MGECIARAMEEGRAGVEAEYERGLEQHWGESKELWLLGRLAVAIGSTRAPGPGREPGRRVWFKRGVEHLTRAFTLEGPTVLGAQIVNDLGVARGRGALAVLETVKATADLRSPMQKLERAEQDFLTSLEILLEHDPEPVLLVSGLHNLGITYHYIGCGSEEPQFPPAAGLLFGRVPEIGERYGAVSEGWPATIMEADLSKAEGLIEKLCDLYVERTGLSLTRSGCVKLGKDLIAAKPVIGRALGVLLPAKVDEPPRSVAVYGVTETKPPKDEGKRGISEQDQHTGDLGALREEFRGKSSDELLAEIARLRSGAVVASGTQDNEFAGATLEELVATLESGGGEAPDGLFQRLGQIVHDARKNPVSDTDKFRINVNKLLDGYSARFQLHDGKLAKIRGPKSSKPEFRVPGSREYRPLKESFSIVSIYTENKQLRSSGRLLSEKFPHMG